MNLLKKQQVDTEKAGATVDTCGAAKTPFRLNRDTTFCAHYRQVTGIIACVVLDPARAGPSSPPAVVAESKAGRVAPPPKSRSWLR